MGVLPELLRNGELCRVVLDSCIANHAASVRLLLIFWCITHDALLFDPERVLYPVIRVSPDVWMSVRAAIDEDRLGDVPVLARTFVAWSGTHTRGPTRLGLEIPRGVEQGPDPEVFRACLKETRAAGLLTWTPAADLPGLTRRRAIRRRQSTSRLRSGACFRQNRVRGQPLRRSFFEQSRYRAAEAAARAAIVLGYDVKQGTALLTRVLKGLGRGGGGL